MDNSRIGSEYSGERQVSPDSERESSSEELASSPDIAGLLPWKIRTPQAEGMVAEQRILQQRGYRAHPRSGAGRIKQDGSSEEEIVEIKQAKSTFQLKGSDLKSAWIDAVRQGKENRWIIEFTEAGITADLTLRKT